MADENNDVLDGFEQQLSGSNGGSEPATTVDTPGGHIYGDSEGLDPSMVGEQLEAQRAEFNRRYTELNTQSAEKIGGLTNELDTVKQRLAELTQQVPTQAPEDPYTGKYGLTEEERAELEPMLSGVDKRAHAAVELGLSKLSERFQQQLEQERSQFSTALEELRSQVNLTTADTNNAFQASASASARSFGLDLQALPNDNEWNDFLKSPASYVSDETFYDVLTKGIAAKNLPVAERVFARFAEVRKTPANQLTGMPNTGGAGRDVPADTATDRITELNNQREMIRNKEREYRHQRDNRTMSHNDFVAKVQALENLEVKVLNDLQAEMAKQPAAQTTQI